MQYFVLSKRGEIIFNDEVCLDFSSDNKLDRVELWECHGLKGNQEWRHSRKTVSWAIYERKQTAFVYVLARASVIWSTLSIALMWSIFLTRSKCLVEEGSLMFCKVGIQSFAELYKRLISFLDESLTYNPRQKYSRNNGDFSMICMISIMEL